MICSEVRKVTHCNSCKTIQKNCLKFINLEQFPATVIVHSYLPREDFRPHVTINEANRLLSSLLFVELFIMFNTLNTLWGYKLLFLAPNSKYSVAMIS